MSPIIEMTFQNTVSVSGSDTFGGLNGRRHLPFIFTGF